MTLDLSELQGAYIKEKNHERATRAANKTFRMKVWLGPVFVNFKDSVMNAARALEKLLPRSDQDVVFVAVLHEDEARTEPSGYVLCGVTNVQADDYLPLKLEFDLTDGSNETPAERYAKDGHCVWNFSDAKRWEEEGGKAYCNECSVAFGGHIPAAEHPRGEWCQWDRERKVVTKPTQAVMKKRTEHKVETNTHPAGDAATPSLAPHTRPTTRWQQQQQQQLQQQQQQQQQRQPTMTLARHHDAPPHM